MSQTNTSSLLRLSGSSQHTDTGSNTISHAPRDSNKLSPSVEYLHDVHPPPSLPTLFEVQAHLFQTQNIRITPLPTQNISTNSQPPLICPTCSQTYTGPYAHRNLARHISALHASNSTFLGVKCSMAGCEKTFRRDDARLVHERRMHPGLMRPVARRKREGEV